MNTEHGHSGSVVFGGFPHHMEDYQADVQAIMEDCLARYGEEEWRLAVVTSELHGHLGIYAIIGAKMGLFAKEYLGAGHDQLSIISRAGSTPPLSCLNDGLQASTGATVGHGSFLSDPEVSDQAAAIFHQKHKRILLSLKDEVRQKVDRDIRAALENNHGLTPGYWEEIRRLALGYWLEFDRNKIFEVQEESL